VIQIKRHNFTFFALTNKWINRTYFWLFGTYKTT